VFIELLAAAAIGIGANLTIGGIVYALIWLDKKAK
jgi:hypothetical protein